MLLDQAIATIVFLAVVAAIVLRLVDETVAALAGVAAMVAFTSYTPLDAFKSVDWNIIAILLGMWIIAAYMVEAGIGEATALALTRISRSYRTTILLLALAAGLISMFVDNVLVIILLGSITIDIARRAGADPVPAILLIGFSANYMGTALLMGDLPPQLLHSIAGAEFLDFIVSRGRPSSFPLLLASFTLVTLLATRIFIESGKTLEAQTSSVFRVNRRLLVVSILFFAATVTGMAIRPLLGVPLGYIALAGAASLALVVESMRALGAGMPSFEEVVSRHVEWRALLFYASLFSLVGGLEKLGVLEKLAEAIKPILEEPQPLSYSLTYWLTAAPSTIVEHDALLLTLLYTVRDAAKHANIDPWPLYWAMAWSATLASNATTAAAPALYVAVAVAEKNGYTITAKTFLKHSTLYVTASLLTHYLITLPVWGYT